jgi:hypothetical protein
VRAGVPAYLDDLTMDLLDKRIAAPASETLAAELARLDAADNDYEDAGPLRFTRGDSGEPGEPVRANRKIIFGIAALLVIALVGLIFGINAINDTSQNNATKTNQSGTTPGGAIGDTGATAPASGGQPAQTTPKKIPLTADMVRIVDPPSGDRADSDEAKFLVDTDKDSGWETGWYKGANFGNLKPGMGVLINLGQQRSVSDVRVEASLPGASMEIRVGTSDPGATSAGDDKIVKTYTRLNDGGPEKMDGTNKIFPGFDPDTKYQYILVWVSSLPKDPEDGKYRITVSNVEVYGN